MQPPHDKPPHSHQQLRRIRLFGAAFILIGLGFAIYGGLNLFEIYGRPAPMFELEAVFTPEKGMAWSKLLAGLSVCLTGILMTIKARSDLKQKNKSE